MSWCMTWSGESTGESGFRHESGNMIPGQDILSWLTKVIWSAFLARVYGMLTHADR